MVDKEIQKALNETDISTIRIVEDLIDILVRKGIIQLSYFNDSIREKLEYRKSLRERL